MSTAGVVDQILSDINRELGGLIEVDGIIHTLVTALEFQTIRVFVGTNLPSSKAALQASAVGATLEPIVLPMGGDELELVAQALLRAWKLIDP